MNDIQRLMLGDCDDVFDRLESRRARQEAMRASFAPKREAIIETYRDTVVPFLHSTSPLAKLFGDDAWRKGRQADLDSVFKVELE
jgi:hypothetical protein